MSIVVKSVFALVIGLVGFGLLIWQNWIIALAVFLMLWGNNIGNSK